MALLLADRKIKMPVLLLKKPNKIKTKAQTPDTKHTKENKFLCQRASKAKKFIVIDCYSQQKQFVFISNRKACELSTKNIIYSWIYCLNSYTMTFEVNSSCL